MQIAKDLLAAATADRDIRFVCMYERVIADNQTKARSFALDIVAKRRP
jgi:hypothetical protein